MKTYLVWDNDESGFIDGWFVTTDANSATHYSSFHEANDVAVAGENRIVLEWK